MDLSSSGQGFIDSLRELADRLDRLEMISNLFIAPVRRAVTAPTWEPLQRYLDNKADAEGLTSYEKEWTRDYTRIYVHKSGVRCDFSGFEENVIYQAVLTVAACEQIMPMRLAEWLWPDQISAVDQLAEVAREPGT